MVSVVSLVQDLSSILSVEICMVGLAYLSKCSYPCVNHFFEILR